MEENQNEREFFTLVDDDGQELEFELIGTAKIKDTTYYAVIPMGGSVQAEDGFCEYVILKGELDENGEGTLVSSLGNGRFLTWKRSITLGHSAFC